MNSNYLKTLQKRTDKFSKLEVGLSYFDRKYSAGDPNFVIAITRLGLLREYKMYLPSEKLLSIVIETMIEKFPKTNKFTQLSFDDMKMFETLFGITLTQHFTFEELRELNL